jgi:hypothetical protein
MLRQAFHLVTVGTLIFAVVGCDKLKTALHPGDDGGSTSASPASGLSPLSLLGGFEGEIDVTMRDTEKRPPENISMAFFVKGEKLRADLPDKFATQSPFGKGYVILDSPAKKLYFVSDAQKQVIVIDLNTSGEKLKGIGSPSHGGGGGARPEGPKTTLTKTGKFDTVAGYKCENWDVASDHRQGTICVAQEGVSWFHIPMTGIPTEHVWMAELLDGKHFPLRFVGYDKDGVTETGRFEVTKIDKKTLPPSEFEYPPTYRIVDIAQMFAGMGAMGGMPGRPGMPPGMPSGMPMMPPVPPRHP